MEDLLGSGMATSGLNNLQRNLSNSSEDSSLLQEAMSSPLPDEDYDTELGKMVKDLSLETQGQDRQGPQTERVTHTHASTHKTHTNDRDSCLHLIEHEH